MRFLKRIAGFLGFSRDEGHEVKDDDEEEDDHGRNRDQMMETGLPRKGFSVPVQVAVDRSRPGPVLAPSHSGDGGLQGLRWFAKRLKVDEDGDVADEFFDEVKPESPTAAENERKPLPKFELKCSTRPARVKKQAITQDGKIQQCVEHQGRLQWV